MSEKEFIYPENAKEISGFGGGYEKTCRRMVINGAKWLEENPKADPIFKHYENITGVAIGDNKDAKSLSNAIVGSEDVTGLMHEAAVNHVLYIKENGWDKYIQEMTKPKEEPHN